MKDEYSSPHAVVTKPPKSRVSSARGSPPAHHAERRRHHRKRCRRWAGNRTDISGKCTREGVVLRSPEWIAGAGRSIPGGSVCAEQRAGCPHETICPDAGIQASGDALDAANNQLLLERMQNVPDDQRAARYVCALCFADPDTLLSALGNVRTGGLHVKHAEVAVLATIPFYSSPIWGSPLAFSWAEGRAQSSRACTARARIRL